MHWRKKWQPTLAFLTGESQGQGSLVCCRLWGSTELDTTEATYQQQQHGDDTTLMAESEELKSLLMKVKEESEKDGLKLNIQKMKIMASSPVTSWQTDGETMETVRDFLRLQNHCGW